MSSTSKQDYLNDTSSIDVTIFELQDGDYITAFTSLDFDKWGSVNLKKIGWIQGKLPKSMVEILREDELVSPFDLVQGDNVLGIYNVPPLKVDDRAKKWFQGNGFTHFKVKVRKKKLSKADETRLKQGVEQANNFIQKTQKAQEMSEHASRSIENVFEDAWSGEVVNEEKINIIKEDVEQIIEDGSAEGITAMASLKESDQTFDHCIQAGAIFYDVYTKTMKKKGGKSVFKDDHECLLSGFMHDIGKSKIPKDVLDKTGKYSEKEWKIMREHPLKGATILQSLKMPSYMKDMALYHHVKVNIEAPNSYPKSIKVRKGGEIVEKAITFDQVPYEARLLAVVDIYQALIGQRKYKHPYDPIEAIEFIEEMTDVDLDADAVEDFINAIGIYPRGSLVELSNGALAFVVSEPELEDEPDLERPQVVIVKTPEGTQINENHELIDLQIEKSLSIKNGKDSKEVFGDKALEVFMNIKIAKV